MMELGLIGVIVIGFLVFLFMLVLVFWSRFKTVGPDEAMIITGNLLGTKNVMSDDKGRKIKIVRGGGAFIWPIVQEKNEISLKQHKLEITTPEVYTEQGVKIVASGTAIIKVESDVEGIATAAEQFMNNQDAIRTDSTDVLEGHLRSILGRLTVEEIYKDRDKFAQSVKETASEDLKRMGLSVVSFTIKDVKDNEQYLDSLGRPRIAEVQRDAEIAEAEAQRDARKRKALADEESQKAEILRDTNVAEAEKEKNLKIAAYQREQDKAKAEAAQAYPLQEAMSRQQVTEQEMQIELVRKQKEILIEQSEIERASMVYDAQVKKKADANRYAVEQEAEAEKTKQDRASEAEKYRIQTKAEAEAEAERISGQAQATVIREKGVAKAEAMEKSAQAYEKFGDAAVLEMVLEMLPQYADKVAGAYNKVDKITIIDNGGSKSSGAQKVSGFVTDLMGTLPETLQQLTGLDMNQMIKNMTEKKLTSDFMKTVNENSVDNVVKPKELE